MTYEPPHLSVLKFLLDLPEEQLLLMLDKDETYGLMAFRDALPMKLAGTGKRALVLKAVPGQNMSAHAIGATVQVCLYADHTRPEGGIPETEDGLDRAWAMFGHADAILQAANPLTTGPKVIQSDRQAQPQESFDRDQDLSYLVATYNVTVYSQK